MHLVRHARAAMLATLCVAGLIALASVLGLALGAQGLYGDPATALGPTPSTAGILVPGFLGHDLFNVIVALPILAISAWMAHRGKTVGVLLWPGALFYVLYTYATYLIGAPFSLLFVGYALLVALSGFTTISLLTVIDREAVCEQLQAQLPARLIGGLLVVLALLTLAQDASGAVSTALSGETASNPLARAVWSVDLSLEVPAVLFGGLLLWRRHSLGYLAAAGLLLQYGLTPAALAFSLLVQGIATGSAVDWGSVGGVLIFALVCFAPLPLFTRARPAIRAVAAQAARASGGVSHSGSH
jgi:hypothetical protein